MALFSLSDPPSPNQVDISIFQFGRFEPLTSSLLDDPNPDEQEFILLVPNSASCGSSKMRNLYWLCTVVLALFADYAMHVWQLPLGLRLVG